jgi:hypothetical protein
LLVITCPTVPVEPLRAIVEATFNVVTAAVAAVVAPTVPLILIEAVPVRFVTVPLDGVPSAPPLTTNAFADPVFTPSAVKTPVPVVVVAGAAPAPPPITRAFAARAAEVSQVVPLEKYGTPPEVPATVSAKVPLVVIGDPLTEIKPPVNDCAMLVTVPTPLVTQLGIPAANVRT